MMYAIRFLPRVVEPTVVTTIREPKIVNVCKVADEMDKSVNAIAYEAVTKKILQACERSNVDCVIVDVSFP